MAKASYRDLKVRAVVDGKESDAFYVKQNSSAEKVERLVLRLDEAKPNQAGEPQTNTSNGDYKIFGNQRTSWLDEKLAGFRRKVGDVTCIVVKVEPSDMPSLEDLEKVEELF